MPRPRKKLDPGTRVRLRDEPIPMKLDALTGSVVGPDKYGCYLVRLDRPGRYYYADGRVEELEVIREMWDNLLPLEPAKPAKKPSGAGRQA